MVLFAIFDVDEPVLETLGHGAAFATLAGGDLNVFPTVVDERNWADEVL